jgi:hypothetical protein
MFVGYNRNGIIFFQFQRISSSMLLVEIGSRHPARAGSSKRITWGSTARQQRAMQASPRCSCHQERPKKRFHEAGSFTSFHNAGLVGATKLLFVSIFSLSFIPFDFTGRNSHFQNRP